MNNPPLHGGGQGFESPRLHSQNMVICRENSKQESAHPLLAKPVCSNRAATRMEAAKMTVRCFYARLTSGAAPRRLVLKVPDLSFRLGVLSASGLWLRRSRVRAPSVTPSFAGKTRSRSLRRGLLTLTRLLPANRRPAPVLRRHPRLCPRGGASRCPWSALCSRGRGATAPPSDARHP
jgi:hypothetical protein